MNIADQIMRRADRAFAEASGRILIEDLSPMERKAIEDDMERKARYVRTPAGVRRFKRPIGAIILPRGGSLDQIRIKDPVFKGFDLVEDRKGNLYDVGKDPASGGKYVVLKHNTWDDQLPPQDSLDKALEALNEKLGGGTNSDEEKPAKKPSGPKKTPDQTPVSDQEMKRIERQKAMDQYRKDPFGDTTVPKHPNRLKTPSERQWAQIDELSDDEFESFLDLHYTNGDSFTAVMKDIKKSREREAGKESSSDTKPQGDAPADDKPKSTMTPEKFVENLLHSDRLSYEALSEKGKAAYRAEVQKHIDKGVHDSNSRYLALEAGQKVDRDERARNTFAGNGLREYNRLTDKQKQAVFSDIDGLMDPQDALRKQVTGKAPANAQKVARERAMERQGLSQEGQRRYDSARRSGSTHQEAIDAVRAYDRNRDANRSDATRPKKAPERTKQEDAEISRRLKGAQDALDKFEKIKGDPYAQSSDYSEYSRSGKPRFAINGDFEQADMWLRNRDLLDKFTPEEREQAEKLRQRMRDAAAEIEKDPSIMKASKSRAKERAEALPDITDEQIADARKQYRAVRSLDDGQMRNFLTLNEEGRKGYIDAFRQHRDPARAHQAGIFHQRQSRGQDTAKGGTMGGQGSPERDAFIESHPKTKDVTDYHKPKLRDMSEKNFRAYVAAVEGGKSPNSIGPIMDRIDAGASWNPVTEKWVGQNSTKRPSSPTPTADTSASDAADAAVRDRVQKMKDADRSKGRTNPYTSSLTPAQKREVDDLTPGEYAKYMNRRDAGQRHSLALAVAKGHGGQSTNTVADDAARTQKNREARKAAEQDSRFGNTATFVSANQDLIKKIVSLGRSGKDPYPHISEARARLAEIDKRLSWTDDELGGYHKGKGKAESDERAAQFRKSLQSQRKNYEQAINLMEDLKAKRPKPVGDQHQGMGEIERIGREARERQQAEAGAPSSSDAPKKPRLDPKDMPAPKIATGPVKKGKTRYVGEVNGHPIAVDSGRKAGVSHVVVLHQDNDAYNARTGGKAEDTGVTSAIYSEHSSAAAAKRAAESTRNFPIGPETRAYVVEVKPQEARGDGPDTQAAQQSQSASNDAPKSPAYERGARLMDTSKVRQRSDGKWNVAPGALPSDLTNLSDEDLHFLEGGGMTDDFKQTFVFGIDDSNRLSAERQRRGRAAMEARESEERATQAAEIQRQNGNVTWNPDLTPVQKGRLDKHLAREYRYEDGIHTTREEYGKTTGKRITAGEHFLVYEDGSSIKVPKMVYDAAQFPDAQSTSSDAPSKPTSLAEARQQYNAALSANEIDKAIELSHEVQRFERQALGQNPTARRANNADWKRRRGDLEARKSKVPVAQDAPQERPAESSSRGADAAVAQERVKGADSTVSLAKTQAQKARRARTEKSARDHINTLNSTERDLNRTLERSGDRMPADQRAEVEQALQEIRAARAKAEENIPLNQRTHLRPSDLPALRDENRMFGTRGRQDPELTSAEDLHEALPSKSTGRYMEYELDMDALDQMVTDGSAPSVPEMNRAIRAMEAESRKPDGDDYDEPLKDLKRARDHIKERTDRERAEFEAANTSLFGDDLSIPEPAPAPRQSPAYTERPGDPGDGPFRRGADRLRRAGVEEFTPNQARQVDEMSRDQWEAAQGRVDAGESISDVLGSTATRNRRDPMAPPPVSRDEVRRRLAERRAAREAAPRPVVNRMQMVSDTPVEAPAPQGRTLNMRAINEDTAKVSTARRAHQRATTAQERAQALQGAPATLASLDNHVSTLYEAVNSPRLTDAQRERVRSQITSVETARRDLRDMIDGFEMERSQSQANGTRVVSTDDDMARAQEHLEAIRATQDYRTALSEMRRLRALERRLQEFTENNSAGVSHVQIAEAQSLLSRIATIRAESNNRFAADIARAQSARA